MFKRTGLSIKVFTLIYFVRSPFQLITSHTIGNTLDLTSVSLQTSSWTIHPAGGSKESDILRQYQTFLTMVVLCCSMDVYVIFLCFWTGSDDEVGDVTGLWVDPIQIKLLSELFDIVANVRFF